MADFDAELPETPTSPEEATEVIPAEAPGGGDSDSAAPEIEFLTAPGEIAIDEEIPIQITDNTGVTTTLITVQYPSINCWDVVYDSDVGFAARYAGSEIEAVTGGFIYHIQTPAWRGNPTFKAWALDEAGNIAIEEAAYTLEVVAPVEVPALSPSTGQVFVEVESLRLACFLSLFSDRRAPSDAELPDGSKDRRGWWGDQFATVPGDQFGSLLWLLDRSKRLVDILPVAKRYAEDALAWLVEDHVASKVEVVVTLERNDAIFYNMQIFRPDKDPASYRFQHVWTPEETSQPSGWLLF